MPKQKWTGQNRIRLVEYSGSEVSDPSEVPQIIGKLFFQLVKEVKLICVRLIELDDIVLVCTSDNLVRASIFQK